MRNQRDEPIKPHIADAADTTAADEKDHINSVIAALEARGITLEA